MTEPVTVSINIQKERDRVRLLNDAKRVLRERIDNLNEELSEYINNIDNLNSLRGLETRIKNLSNPKISSRKRAKRIIEKENKD